ncbi:MAG: hypothetical protein IPP41_07830 [Rhodocyclaceae bacterium]|nr:hypothetical protein [Rhodocyclaceae bacterium]
MKKVLFAASLLAVGGMAHAAAADITSGADITTGSCTLLASPVKIVMSTGNIGSYDCVATTANIGVAIGNTSGKFKVFSIGSNGGALTTDTYASTVTTTQTQSAATARGSSSS